MYILPNDTCRCHDETCEKRLGCLRFLQRDMGDDGTPHAYTLRIGDEDCPWIWPVGGNDHVEKDPI